jgi:translation initiation factor IF-1
LVGLREFGDDKGDVILKYYDEEAKELKELGEIPEHIKINEGDFVLVNDQRVNMFLILGKISQVFDDPSASTMSAQVQPLKNFNDLHRVFIRIENN